MDEVAEPENVKVVLVQEFSELLSILRRQPAAIIEELCQVLPGAAPTGLTGLTGSAPAGTALGEPAKMMLEHFAAATAEECCHFLQTVCMLCENIPLGLETRLISVAGHGNNVSRTPTVKKEVLPSSPSDCQLIKRPRIDYWEENINAVASLLEKRWKQLTENLACEVLLEKVWVSPRVISRVRIKPDQTPGPLGKGSKADNEGDLGSVEPRMPLERFLSGCAGKVTVLIGPSGSGKSLLLSCLGQQWARKLGPIHPSVLFVLLEFRQLSLISRSLSLSELLFQHFLPPTVCSADKRAIMDYLLSNPEQSCWVLDGYDEFNSKLPTQVPSSKVLDQESPRTVPELISGLLNGQLLPGSTVLITCRAPSRDLEGLSNNVGHLMGWNVEDIKEYVYSFFQVKGSPHSESDRAKREFGMQAADLLLSTRHLLSMSALPALCNICCICLEHLLRHVKNSAVGKMSAGTESKTETNEGKDRVEQMPREDGQLEDERRRLKLEASAMDGRSEHVPLLDQIPSTLTQVCLTVLGSFLRHDAKEDRSTVHILGQYGHEVRELSQLAWEGVEGNKSIFPEKDISPEVLQFANRTRILSKVEVRSDNGPLVNYYCFTQLTLQEFLGALRIMTSQHVHDDQLKRRFNLKTRWTTKSDQKPLFDSLQLFVCGLATPHCTPALVQVARSSTRAEIQLWVKKRQQLVLQLLHKLCLKTNLTGPKMLELCHCIQESQDQDLARRFVTTRPTLELRNIRLLPSDIDALAFVCNSVGDSGVGLDFGACSMELECLDVLQRCRNIQHLCFQSRKYGNKFAEKLSTILSEFKMLKKLEFCATSLTGAGAAALASAIQKCPHIREINLSNNVLKDAGIKHVADVLLSEGSTLDLVMLGQNNSSLKAVKHLIEKVSTCSNIQDVHVDGNKTLKVTLSHSSGANKQKPSISLLNQNWSKSQLKSIAVSVAKCPPLSVLDLSGCQWDVETLRTLARSVPTCNITKQISLNGTDLPLDNLLVLTQLLSECAALKELHIRLQPSPAQVTLHFSEGEELRAGGCSKVLSLTSCGLFSADLEKILKSLGTSSGVSLLDVSGNHLNSSGLKKLLEFLHHLRGIRKIEASNNSICVEGVVLLAGALCNHDNLSQVQISNGGREQLTLHFGPHRSFEKEQLKTFRINRSNLEPADVSAICRRLVKCRSRLELDLSQCSLEDDAVERLCGFLSKMAFLRKLNVTHSITSAGAALMLVNCLTVSDRVASIELRPRAESLIHFDADRMSHSSCRMTHFSLTSKHMRRLTNILLRTSRLSDLDLSSNQLGDEGVRSFLDALPKLNILRCVNLSNNGLTLKGLLHAAGLLCTWEKVCAVDISLREEQRCLVRFSQQEDCETSLRIAESGLERDHLVGLAQTVCVYSRLSTVELLNNSLQADWVEDFVQLLGSVERTLSVSLDERWIQSQEAVNMVCRCLKINRRIHTIRVHCTTLQLCFVKASRVTSVSGDLSDQPPSALTENISLVDCAVEGHQLVAMTSIIQECPALTHFQFLTHTSLGEKGAEFLCSVVLTQPNLTSLSVASKGTCLDALLAEAFFQAATLQCLNLSGHVIGDSAASIMSRMIPRLHSLTLSHCEWSGSPLLLIRALEQCVGLEALCLDALQLDEDSMACLAQSLRSLRLMRRLKLSMITTAAGSPEATSVLPITVALEGFTNIETLELEGWRMADGETEQLTSLLPAWTGLRRISLSNNRISDRSGDRLLRTLEGCVYLEELHVSSNSLGDVTAGTMALVLPSLTRITVLDLSENAIGPEGSASLSEAMAALKNLTKLLLTSVGTSKLCAVAASLAHCPLIQEVGLGWNNCGNDVALELAKVLPLCQKLIRIDLESNQVSVFGAEALLKASQACPTLQLIRLWKNQVSAKDASRLRLMDRRLNFSSM